MTSNTNRNRGAVAAILDTDALGAAARTVLTIEDPTLDVSGVSMNMLAPHMLITATDGRKAVVNHEGVGAFEVEGAIKVWASEGFGSFPVAVPVDAITAIATEEKTDLADGIRVFGARLDSNHHQWWWECEGRNDG